MARKYVKRKSVMKKRGARKSTAKPRIPGVYNYKRYCSDSTLINTGPAAGDLSWNAAQANWLVGPTFPDDNGLFQFGGSLNFQLNDVLQANEFVSLYDSYKITAVKLTFMPLANQGYVSQSSNTNTSSTTIPTIYYAMDDDDSTLPASSQEMLVKQRVKVRRLDKVFSVTIKNPKVLQALQTGGGAILTNANPRTPWIDCNSPNVDFYGFKFYIRDMPIPIPNPAPATGINSLIRVQAQYFLSFKDPQ